MRNLTLKAHKDLQKSIQKALHCNKSRAKEVIGQLRETKAMFKLSHLSLYEIWQQEKPYLVEHGKTAFYVGLLDGLRGTKSNEIA